MNKKLFVVFLVLIGFLMSCDNPNKSITINNPDISEKMSTYVDAGTNVWLKYDSTLSVENSRPYSVKLVSELVTLDLMFEKITGDIPSDGLDESRRTEGVFDIGYVKYVIKTTSGYVLLTLSFKLPKGESVPVSVWEDQVAVPTPPKDTSSFDDEKISRINKGLMGKSKIDDESKNSESESSNDKSQEMTDQESQDTQLGDTPNGKLEVELPSGK